MQQEAGTRETGVPNRVLNHVFNRVRWWIWVWIRGQGTSVPFCAPRCRWAVGRVGSPWGGQRGAHRIPRGPRPHQAHQQLRNTAPTRTHGVRHAAKKNTSKLRRNSQLEERNDLRGNLARALPRCPAGGSHGTPSSSAAGAPFHCSLCTGLCLGKGPWCPRVPLLSLSPPASFRAGSGARRTELCSLESSSTQARSQKKKAQKGRMLGPPCRAACKHIGLQDRPVTQQGPEHAAHLPARHTGALPFPSLCERLRASHGANVHGELHLPVFAVKKCFVSAPTRVLPCTGLLAPRWARCLRCSWCVPGSGLGHSLAASLAWAGRYN